MPRLLRREENRVPLPGWRGTDSRAGAKGRIVTVDDPLGLGLSTKQINDILEFRRRQEVGDVSPFLLGDYGWHKFDNWTKRQGLLLLCGMEPNGTKERRVSSSDSGATVEFDHILLLDLRQLDRTVAEACFRPANLSTSPELAKACGTYLDDFDMCALSYNHLLQLWNSGDHQDRHTPRYFVKWAESKGVLVPWLEYARKMRLTSLYEDALAEHGAGNEGGNGRNHVSDRLATLNQAAQKFWANADPGDPTTHTNNAVIAAWLEERGFSLSLAESGASIIRPEWAHKGRKPDA